MHKQQTTTVADYALLQQTLDTCIGKIGLPRTIKVLRSLVSGNDLNLGGIDRLGMVHEYLKAEVVRIFHLEADHLLSCDEPDYYDARMTCFALLREFEKCGPSQIARLFNGRSKRQVIYWLREFEQRKQDYQYDLANRPAGRKPLHGTYFQRYESVENGLLEFLSKLTD